jgi:hypothetical protein
VPKPGNRILFGYHGHLPDFSPSAARLCDDLLMKLLHDSPVNSGFADRVGRSGFRKWYERELLSSHVHLLLCFLSVIALLSSIEAFRGGSPNEKVTGVVFVIVCAAVGLWALRRYLFLLMHAEGIANQANCPDCGEYGRFTVVATNRDGAETQVCCRKCTHKWVITDTGT